MRSVGSHISKYSDEYFTAFIVFIFSLFNFALLASYFGFTPAIIVSVQGWSPLENSWFPISKKDLDIIFSIVYHIAIAFIFTITLYGVGAGLYILVFRGKEATLSHIILAGYPLGIMFAVVISAISIYFRYGIYIAAVLIVISLLPLCRWKRDISSLKSLARMLSLIAPFAVLLSLIMGLQWHGPTDTISVCSMGDLVWYAGQVNSIASNLYPHVNLGLLGDTLYATYSNKLMPVMVVAALLHAPRIDPFLFFAVVGPFFAVISLGMCIYLFHDLARPVVTKGEIRDSAIFTISFLIIGAVPYSSWIIEAANAPYTFPLAFSIFYIITSEKSPIVSNIKAFIFAIIGALLTKIVWFVAFTGLIAGNILSARTSLSLGYYIKYLSLPFILGLIYSAYFLSHFGLFYLNVPIGPETIQFFTDISSNPPLKFLNTIFREFGLLFLGIAVIRLGNAPVCFACLLGLLFYFTMPGLFHSLIPAVIILVSCAIILHPNRFHNASLWLVSAAIFLSMPRLFSNFMDITWFICVGLSVWIALKCGRSKNLTGRFAGWKAARNISFGVIFLVALIVLSVGKGSLIIDSCLNHDSKLDRLTPTIRDIWRAVRERTPANSLIFTDQTGEEIALDSGWNSYSFFGQRQIYISNWLISGLSNLKNANESVRDRLTLNMKVLSGALKPGRIDSDGKYEKYYAVVNRLTKGPRNHAMGGRNNVTAPYFKLIYENEEFQIYEIPN